MGSMAPRTLYKAKQLFELRDEIGHRWQRLEIVPARRRNDGRLKCLHGLYVLLFHGCARLWNPAEAT